MDRVRAGRSIRAIRVRLGLRQSDVAARAGVSRAAVSKIERGEAMSVDMLDRVCRVLGADVELRVRWRGEAIDRLLDESHARLVEQTVSLLQEDGFEVAVEVTFNVYGDRGSIDVLGWRPDARALLVCEIKSVVADAQGTLLPLDRKARLGAQIGSARGWPPLTVSRLLVVAEGSTNRDRIGRLAASFEAALPVRAVAFRAWLRNPSGPVSALLFLRDATPGGVRHGRAGQQRVTGPRRARGVPG